MIKAQNADDATCVKNVSKGKTTVALCYGTDAAGKVAKAQAKTTATNGKKCNDTDERAGLRLHRPDHGEQRGSAETLEASTIVLGAVPNVIVAASDKNGASARPRS